MNVQKYIESGIIEEFCLGLLSDDQAKEVMANASLFPEIQQEIEQTEEALAAYAHTPPRPALREQVLKALSDVRSEEKINPKNPPPIHRYSNAAKWNEALSGIEPNLEHNGLKLFFLRKTKESQLYIAWLRSELVEDAHHRNEFQESFLILEGTCECILGNQTIQLRPGDYVDIPFDTPHTIKVTSTANGFLKALIQRAKLAA